MKKVTFTSYCLMLCGIFMLSELSAQTNVNMPYNNGPVTFTIAPPTVCFFNFFDNGGAAANYSDFSGVNSVVTFAPSNSATHRISVTFNTFQTEAGWDALYVFDGPSTASPLISSGLGPTFNFPAGGWQGTGAPNNFAPNVVRATAANASGALTFQFRSDASVPCSGWSAVVAQVPISPCTMTAGGPATVSTDQFTCTATASLALPTFSPGGCQSALTFRYLVDGGTPVVVNPPLPNPLVIPGLQAGVHIITYQLVDPCGNVVVSSATQQVTVLDQVPPVITCPANINQILGPGECSAFIGYTVTATDNCPIFNQPVVYTQNPPNLNPNQAISPGLSLNCPFIQTKWGRVFGGPTQPTVRITGLEVGIRTAPAIPPNNYTFNVYLLTSGTAPAAGNANMLLVGGPFNFVMPAVNTTYVPITFPTPVNIPAGSRYFIEIIDQNGDFTMGNIEAPDLPGTPSYIMSTPCGLPSYATFASIGFADLSLAFNVVGLAAGPPIPVQTAGLPSGSEFPIGTTTNCFTVADETGNTATCCFSVTISEFPNPTTTLACNDNIQVSVNEDCEAFITTDMVLEGGPYGCYDEYLVAVQGFGSGFGGVLINSSAIGQTLTVTVTDPATGNNCWGTISVEDKLPPIIECLDITVVCGEVISPQPSPEISGYQNLIITGLNDLLENNVLTYDFDFSYLPSTAVLDVDVRIQIDDHTWLPDVKIDVESPDGTVRRIFDVANCIAQEFPINTIFDDEGLATMTLCNELNGGPTSRVQPVLPPGVATPVLFQFDGLEASGLWHVRISDIFPADDGHVREVGLFINVNIPQVDPADNCGNVNLTFTDTQLGDPCEGLIILRRFVATDNSGNIATCIQQITVEPLVIEDVVCPPAYVGDCGDSIDPDETGWPTVNGSEITDDNNICNIFVGYWDKELNDCGEGVKIVRTWTVLDWCTQQTIECVQVIKMSDDEGPVMTCPTNITVGTDFWFCFANVSVPRPTVVDECGSSFTLSMTASSGIVVNFGNNYVINQLGLGTHVVTWRATDECGNSSTCTFTVTVKDNVVPVANCDHHTIVSLTNDGPFGVTLVPATVFDDGSYDNCGPVTFRARRMDSCINFDWTTEGACIDHIPGGVPPVNSRDRGTVHRPCVPFACCDVGAGPVMVELEVTDASGNVNFCMVEVTVQDKISPFIICPPDIIVSCDFWFAVQEGTFVDANGNNNGMLDEDPLSPVFGNMFDAFRFNDDESVRQAIIINDPGNNTISQPHFWGIDGWADDNCQVNLQVRVRIVDDCSGDDLPANAPPGAVRLIERRFSASDGGEGIAPGTCTQRIWVVDFNPFFITDVTCNNSNPNDGVIWPCDVVLTTCPDNLGNTGQPTVFDDACSLIGVAFEDTRFNFVDGACFKILRKWSVIDWCQYNPLTGAGLWMYTQVIKVHDHDGPLFQTCPTGPVVLCVLDPGVSLPANNQVFLGEADPLSSSCSAHLNLCQAVVETCSDFVQFDVKIYPFNGDGFIQVRPTTTVAVDSNNVALLCFDTRQSTIQAIRLNGIPYNSPWCGDYHRILWSVEDDCGNFSFCEYLFRLEDCKQPTPVCINGLSTVVMPANGQVTIWAKDFDASSFDDCTPANELLFSFSGDTYQPSFTYTCENVPAFGVQIAVNIWVADFGTDDNCNNQISWNERNKDFCTTTIVITDNSGICVDTTGSVLGEILTEDAETVEKVAVNLTSPGHVFPTYVTVQDGKYSFSINNIILPLNFTINAERNDAHRNGVSTLDLVKIQKHLLGLETMSSPYDLIAADANNSANISAIDLVELRKLILGIYTELPNNKSWRFVDAAFQFADPTHPWPFSEVISVDNMATPFLYDKDFVAVKVGDVNNSVQANANQILPRNGNGVVSFVTDERTVSAGEMVDVTITSSDFASIEGYQFTMQTSGLQFHGVESGIVSMNDENMGVFGSTLTASWHKVGGVSAKASDVLFTLHFQATAGGRLSEMIKLNSRETQAEAYNTSADIKDLKLTFRGAENVADFALYQNEPNPFKGTTVIGYDLPEAGNVTLTVFDVTGRVVYVKDQNSVKGYNTIALSSKEIASIGVLYYRLDANEYTATKKMVIIE